MEKKIVPAIIAKNQTELNASLSKVLDYFNLVQLDIMDNKFVPNTSLFFNFSLPKSNCKYEAHLMIKDPQDWVEKNIDKVHTVLVHFESDYNPDKIIDFVKKHNKKFGFVLNPETSVEKISEYIDNLDQVLIMTVNPGFYGSPFLPEMLEKIKKLREMKNTLDIEVDGGITDKTISLVDIAGANIFVSGSYIVKSADIKGAINNLEKIIQ